MRKENIKSDNQSIEKIIFWDYGMGAFNILPVETVGQRLVDRWAAIDIAYHEGKLTSDDMRKILRRIASAGDNIIYCESVREYVIKKMIERYVNNIT